jgi:hypothetical protein
MPTVTRISLFQHGERQASISFNGIDSRTFAVEKFGSSQC